MAIGVVGNDKKNKLLHIKQNKYYDDTFKPDIHNENESHALICQNVKKETRVCWLFTGNLRNTFEKRIKLRSIWYRTR